MWVKIGNVHSKCDDLCMHHMLAFANGQSPWRGTKQLVDRISQPVHISHPLSLAIPVQELPFNKSDLVSGASEGPSFLHGTSRRLISHLSGLIDQSDPSLKRAYSYLDWNWQYQFVFPSCRCSATAITLGITRCLVYWNPMWDTQKEPLSGKRGIAVGTWPWTLAFNHIPPHEESANLIEVMSFRTSPLGVNL